MDSSWHGSASQRCSKAHRRPIGSDLVISDRVIGVIGGGQLARMMYSASIPLGLTVRLLAEAADSSAAQVVRDTMVGDYTDPQVVKAFAAGCDVITFDHEHVPTDLLHELEASGTAVRPGPDALIHAQDKAVMRARMTELGIPCPVWRVCRTVDELVRFGDEIGWPIIAKTSRGGYDGKGVWKVDAASEAGVPFSELRPDLVIVAEEYIPFVRELSALVVRGTDGLARAYPISETVQRDSICHETTTPAPGLPNEVADRLARHALLIAEELGVVGLLAVELMECPDGRAVVNELAMRPHNTGHWTIEGAVTSQFENHLRAVAGLPLGDTSIRDAAVCMSNVLGGPRSDLVGALGVVCAENARARVHLYGKEVKPGRKVGHVTVCGSDAESVQREARLASDYLEGRR